MLKNSIRQLKKNYRYIEEQVSEIVMGNHFIFNRLGWNITDMIMIANKFIPENLVVTH